MKITLAVVSIFFISCSIKAQSTLPPVYEIISDTAYIQRPDSIYWQKLEDKKGKWTFEDVSKEPLAGKFHIEGIKPKGIETNGIHTYWHRYRLKNKMNRELKISLTSPVDFFDVYVIKQDSPIIHYKSGWLRKWEEKDGLKSVEWAGALPLILSAGDVITVYDRRSRERDTNFRTSVRLFNTDKLIQEQYINYVDSRTYYYAPIHLQEAFVIGLIFLSIFISIFFYLVVREKGYVYFALFGFFLAIIRTYNIANDYTKWYEPALNKFVPYLSHSWIFIPFFLIQFIRSFFDLKMTYRRWDKFLFIAGSVQLLVGVIAFITYAFSSGQRIFWINDLSAFLSIAFIPACILATALLFLRKHNSIYRFVAIGAIPLMLLYVISSIAQAQQFYGEAITSFLSFLLPYFRLIEVIFLSWLILCFTWVLFIRFNRLRKENVQQALDKERLAKEKEIERNELIAKQKSDLEIEVAERTSDLKKSLEELKSTQAQLIQSEKMASLGELTAGIAHEIQNPLNFVNNFSEVNNELLQELKAENKAGNADAVEAIAQDLEQNLEKINYHGKRADAIVKGMLQHSRTSTGEKQLTDINVLTGEYLHLSYHGLRAKDKTFNAELKTDFDESIGEVNIVPQDMGRVLLNLFNNAFYTVHERLKKSGGDYKPTVIVSTKKLTDKIEIRVQDNGMGIPKSLVDKIFQPFFTTKPTGEGTGLGLSLSYDIVKAHGGELKVISKEGAGTVFIIQLQIPA